MFLNVFNDGSAEKAPSPKEAAARSLSADHARVIVESEADGRAFIEAHEMIVGERVRHGIGFAT